MIPIGIHGAADINSGCRRIATTMVGRDGGKVSGNDMNNLQPLQMGESRSNKLFFPNGCSI
jgi:hypothetical protein